LKTSMQKPDKSTYPVLAPIIKNEFSTLESIT
jgi:hypothetical protein